MLWHSFVVSDILLSCPRLLTTQKPALLAIDTAILALFIEPESTFKTRHYNIFVSADYDQQHCLVLNVWLLNSETAQVVTTVSLQFSQIKIRMLSNSAIQNPYRIVAMTYKASYRNRVCGM